MSIIVLHENCDPSLANDRSLPYTAYLVTYEKDGKTCYDITMCGKKVELFDYYWDQYREGLKTFKQSEGRVNPKIWENPAKSKGKKKA